MYAGKYVWSVGNREYVLVPEVRRSPRKVWLLGAGMYTLDGDYVGYWARREMPIRLIRDLSAYWKRKNPDISVGSGTVRSNLRGRKPKR